MRNSTDDDSCHVDGFKPSRHLLARGIVSALELPLIIFPVAVVMGLSLTFLFPTGRCTAWHWWCPVIVAIWLCFRRAKSFKYGILAVGCFLAFLAVDWMGSNIFMTLPNPDIDRCHGPTVLMMIEGWNPVWDGNFSKITQSLAIPLEGFSRYHVIPLHKCIHYFSAVAYFFTGSVFNLFAPLSFFLFAGLAFSLFRFLGRVPSWLKLTALALIYVLSPCTDQIVDMAVCVSGIWLLLSMWGCLRSGRIGILHLAIPTFWLVASKPSGLLHGMVFWCVFLFVICVKRRTIITRAVVPFTISLGLAVIVMISPYVTSYVWFSHPLYPKYTSDGDRFPSRNIVSDFMQRNEDAAQMGRLGSWVNAYVSTYLTKTYYNAKLERKDFFPDGSTWRHGGNTVPNGSPTSTRTKILFALPLVFLLCFSGRRRIENIFIAVCLVVGTMSMPCEMIGYLRYVAWWFSGLVFCIPVLYESAPKILSKCGLCLIVACVVLSSYPALVKLSISADNHKAAIDLFAKETVPLVIVASHDDRRPVPADLQYAAYAMLQRRSALGLHDAKVLVCPDNTSLAQSVLARWSECEMFYNDSFRLAPGTDLKKYSFYRRELAHKKGIGYTMTSMKFILRTFTITLPKSCWQVLLG